MMNREDILRELELLPVWQLRNPPVTDKKTETLPSVPLIEQARQDHQAEPHVSRGLTCRLIVSEDGQWLFALKQQHQDEAETLLQNMLKAIAVKIGHDINAAQLTAMADFKPKVMVVMGELVAQQLLALDLPLVKLRGAVHRLNEMPVIVTYAPDDLLQHVKDKANAWEDLCLARLTLAHL